MPIVIQRSSSSPSSRILIARVSSSAVTASARRTRCLRRFALALAGSHSASIPVHYCTQQPHVPGRARLSRRSLGGRYAIVDDEGEMLNLAQSEHQTQAELGLTRVAQSTLDGAIEIEQQAGRLRVLRIGAIGEVESVHDGLQMEALTELDCLGGTKIEREKRIVLPERVSPDDIAVGQNAIRDRFRLGSVEADQRREIDSPRCGQKTEQIETVPFHAI